MDATATATTTASIESLFAHATPPRAGSTSWYDACDLLATSIKASLRERFERGFLVEVYGDEVGVIARIRGDGYGVGPWSVDLTMDPAVSLRGQIDGAVERVAVEVERTYRTAERPS